MGLQEARTIVDWMVMPQEDGGGGRRAEWVPAASAGGSEKTIAWIWWRRPEEWAKVIADWVCFSMRIYLDAVAYESIRSRKRRRRIPF